MTQHFAHTRLKHKAVFRLRAGILALIALTATLAAAAPASAGHDGPASRPTAVERSARSHGGFKYVSYADREHQRGYVAGRRDGWITGLQDARWRQPFCDQPRLRLKRQSRHFRHAYRDGFAEAYAQGFRKGRRPQRHRFLRWSWR